MKRSLTRCLVACALVLLTASAASAKDKWLALRTRNFNIVGNANEDDTRQLALKLEQFRLIISRLTNTSNVAPVPITVVVFKNDGSFKPFKPLYNGKPANVSGFFQQSEDENLIALEDSAPAARVRAYDYLAARGKALPGYDPLAPAKARRAALEKAREVPPAAATQPAKAPTARATR